MGTRTAAIAIAAVATLTLHAQAPQTPVTTPIPPDHPRPTITQTNVRAEPAHGAMTVSGCLQQATDARDKAPNVAARDGFSETYLLSNVKMSPSSSVSGIGVSTKYEIQGLAEMELKKHLNHEVELMGQIVPPEAGAPTSNTSVFRATTLKMLSATCGAAQ
jgi:hypothetical protein